MPSLAPVSLVMTVYNRASYLDAAIQSILEQTYPTFELLIWDDGSQDNSLEIAQTYAAQDKRIRLIAAPHQGRAPALQAALAAATGNYLGIVDSDDFLVSSALAETTAILNAHPEIGMVYTDHLLIDHHNQVYGLGECCKIPYSPDRLLVDFMTFHFRLMRCNIYEQIGGIDPRFICAQDYDLCLKLSEVTQIYHLQRPLYFYRIHPRSISQSQRLTQIHWSTQAIHDAMTRRKLTDQYELDIQLSARYSIRPKQNHCDRNLLIG
jgi:glycosyltransferase involved in cell wall biosynthesis